MGSKTNFAPGKRHIVVQSNNVFKTIFFVFRNQRDTNEAFCKKVYPTAILLCGLFDIRLYRAFTVEVYFNLNAL